MKSFIVLAFCVAAALAAPASLTADSQAQILRQDFDNIGIEGYRTLYETSNGIKAEEQGQLRNAGAENEALAVSGSYSYVGDDGVQYTVNYISDENGFQPQGAHLPRA